MVQFPRRFTTCYQQIVMMNHRLRVAVVDDDESVRKALKRLLRAFNLEAEIFASGQEFLNSLTTRRPDCLILDLHMPGMNGLEVQRVLAQTIAHLPVVVITGHDEPQTRTQCMAAGAAAYLCKPLDDKALLEAIQRAAGAAARPSTAGPLP